MSTSFLPYDATDGSLQATFPESPQSEKMHQVPFWSLMMMMMVTVIIIMMMVMTITVKVVMIIVILFATAMMVIQLM